MDTYTQIFGKQNIWKITFKYINQQTTTTHSLIFIQMFSKFERMIRTHSTSTMGGCRWAVFKEEQAQSVSPFPTRQEDTNLPDLSSSIYTFPEPFVSHQWTSFLSNFHLFSSQSAYQVSVMTQWVVLPARAIGLYSWARLLQIEKESQK